MTIETATYISELNPATIGNTTDPTEGGAQVSLVKSVLQSSFPNISGAVTASHTELNYVDVTTLGTAQASKALTVSAGSAVNATGITWTSLGTVTTADINGGTIDGTVIGGSTAAAGSFTTVAASGALTVTGIQTLTGATTLGTSLTLASGATVTEFSTDGTMAGNSDAAVPTEKAVKTYVDALDFASETYVDNKARVVYTGVLDLALDAGATIWVPIGVNGTVTRFDATGNGFTRFVTLRTASNVQMASLSVGGGTALDSETSITSPSVTTGSYVIVLVSSSGGPVTIAYTITVAI